MVSPPLVCNNIFNSPGRPREEFLVFGEPESLQCDFRHSGQRSLITSAVTERRVCSCVCVCVLEVVVFSFSCAFISKHVVSVRGEVILEMPVVRGECLCCCSSSLCSLFPIAQI